MSERAHQIQALIEQLQSFLDAPAEAEGEWPAIAQEELQTAGDLIQQVFDLKWGRATNGDAPIAFSLWNRGQERLLLDWVFLQLPGLDESLKDGETRALHNLRQLSVAADGLAHELSRTSMELSEIQRARQRQEAAVELHQMVYIAPSAWYDREGVPEQAVVSLHRTGDDALAFCHEHVAQGFKFVRHELVTAEPGRSEAAAGGFQVYREKVTAACDSIMLASKARRELNLAFNRTLARASD